MTVTGKIQKFKMREAAVEELGLDAPPPSRLPDDSATEGSFAARGHALPARPR